MDDCTTTSSLPGGTVVKNLPANAGDTEDTGLLPGEGHGSHSSILAWRIAWTEEAGGLQSMGSQTAGTTGHTDPHITTPSWSCSED